MSTANAILIAARDHAAAGRTEQAIAAVRRVLQKEPGHAEANNSMAALLYRAGRLEQALYYAGLAVKASPGVGDFHSTQAKVLLGLKRRKEAAVSLRRAVEAEPGCAAHRIDLMPLLWEQADYAGALEMAREAWRAEPHNTHARNTYYSSLGNTGDGEETIRLTLEALKAEPMDSALLAMLCGASNYSPSLSAAEIFDAHVRHGRVLAALTKRLPELPRPGAGESERKLRVGYLSPDLYTHSVSFFLEPILRHRDRERFETFCYSIRPNLDETTERLKALVGSGWRDLGAADDEAIVQKIRSDRIDILVDLAGHTGPNQPWLMARKAAPIQVTAIGYPNTTGIAAVDYRIVDSLTDPQGAESLATEELIRLDPCFLCYTPPQAAPEPAPPPCLERGHITFGSFNNCIKLSAPVMALWARVLDAVPGSRLLVKSTQFSAPLFKDKYAKRFADAGVDPDRLELVGRIPDTAGHLGAYARVDIALDPFPYNGTTTTCEALFMGVPTVTLAGDRHAARVGVSLLTAAGMPELIARSPDEYVELARRLASDPAGLAGLRREIRPRLLGSPLCDGPGYARRLEEAYRAMWRRWCAAS